MPSSQRRVVAAVASAALVPAVVGQMTCSLHNPDAWKSWSEVQQAACCSADYACPASWSLESSVEAKDCRQGMPSEGSPGQDWCCLVCPMPPIAGAETESTHDCTSGMWPSWDELKRDACCEKMGFGCGNTLTEGEDDGPKAMEHHDCEVGKSSSAGPAFWTAGKRLWCCRHWGVGCHPGWKHHKCDAAFLESVEHWAPARLAWCCLHGAEEVKARLESHSVCNFGWPKLDLPTAAPAAVEAATSASLGGAVNCDHLTAETPKLKKDFCCKFHQVGCEGATARVGEVPTVSPPAQSSDTAQEFDCNDQASTWKDVWTTDKIRWCCQHERKACTSAWKPEDEASATQVVTTTPAADPNGCLAIIQTGSPNTDEERAKAAFCCDGWSGASAFPPLGQAFCCLLSDKECGMRLATTDCSASSSAADEDEEDVTRWTTMRMEWCCVREQKGCATAMGLVQDG